MPSTTGWDQRIPRLPGGCPSDLGRSRLLQDRFNRTDLPLTNKCPPVRLGQISPQPSSGSKPHERSSRQLFPTAQFRFKSSNTGATASFAATGTHNSIHTTLKFYIHGAQYVEKDGTAVNGTYMPVAFESTSYSVAEETALLPSVPL